MADVKPDEILGMSDEDFAKMAPPTNTADAGSEEEKKEVDPAEKNGEDEPSEKPGGDPPEGEGEDKADTKSSDEDSKGEDTQQGGNAEEPEAVSKPKPKAKDGQKAEASQIDKADPDSGGGKGTASETGGEPSASEVAADFYKRVVETPIKANGKTIALKNADEAIALMQMGANYTRKMQDLAPYRKAMAMLEKHGLLGEDDLSFLIDIKNKNPDAIRKLVKDSGIDPMDLEEDAGKPYQAGNHRVTDEEVRFRETMDELKSTSEGQATLNEIHAKWDDASKDILWTQPGIMNDINLHRANGFYAMVTSEIDRQKALGQIPANTPFLHAYKKVGDEFIAQNRLPAGLVQSGGPKVDSTAKPVATGRTTATKAVVSNSDRAAAATSTRSTTKVAPRPQNPLAMADDEFMKQFANRL